MAFPDWPGTIPSASHREGYGVPKSDVEPIMSTMESGRVRMRVQSSLIIRQQTWSRHLNATQMTAWKTFIETTTQRGTSRFNMPIWSPATRTYSTKVCYIVRGMSGVVEAEVGLTTKVSFTLAIENP